MAIQGEMPVAYGGGSSFNVSSGEVDPGMIAFSRLFIYDQEWLRLQKKGKIPKVEMDASVARVIQQATEIRLERYEGDLQVSNVCVAY